MTPYSRATSIARRTFGLFPLCWKWPGGRHQLSHAPTARVQTLVVAVVVADSSQRRAFACSAERTERARSLRSARSVPPQYVWASAADPPFPASSSEPPASIDATMRIHGARHVEATLEAPGQPQVVVPDIKIASTCVTGTVTRTLRPGTVRFQQSTPRSREPLDAQDMPRVANAHLRSRTAR